MIDTLERFINRLSDMDWTWGPLLFLRPAQTERMTWRFWLKMLKVFGFAVLLAAPLGGILGGMLACYDYMAAKHHEAKIAPVAVTEQWMNTAAPGIFFSVCGWFFGIGIAGCVAQHWGWNRRADRLSREFVPPPPVPADVPGVWPPAPTVRRL